MKSFVVCTIKYFSGNNIEKNEIGGTCCMHVGEAKYVQVFSGKT